MTTTPKALPAKWRKKPVVVEARQITDAAALFDIMRWIDSNGGRVKEWCWDDLDGPVEPAERYIDIKTLEGVIRASESDWVIQGVAGEFYPCKPDIFAATYEAADSLASAGGVEVVAYLVSGGRIFKDQAVTHKDSARTRIAERKDGSVAHPLVKQSDYLAALSKEREVADGLAEAVDRLIACYSVSHSPDQRKSCWDQAKAALTAHRESRGGK